MAEDNGREREVIGTKAYDATYRSLHGIPDATFTQSATVKVVTPILELTQTYIVQTCRHRERGDTVFIEYIGSDGAMRVVLPPDVTARIARQRDALSTKIRKRVAKAEAARRKAAGIQPAFLKKKGHK